jgi:hypothetical protein
MRIRLTTAIANLEAQIRHDQQGLRATERFAETARKRILCAEIELARLKALLEKA